MTVCVVFLQSDGSAETTPSRSQKIARAKWEFLFGGQREENRCSGGVLLALPHLLT